MATSSVLRFKVQQSPYGYNPIKVILRLWKMSLWSTKTHQANNSNHPFDKTRLHWIYLGILISFSVLILGRHQLMTWFFKTQLRKKYFNSDWILWSTEYQTKLRVDSGPNSLLKVFCLNHWNFIHLGFWTKQELSIFFKWSINQKQKIK